jgi:putative hydrolase of the HAD superfamily
VIKAVIFDLGNVLVDFDHRLAARRAAAFSDKPAEEIFRLFFDSPVTALFEQGGVTPEDFFQRLRQAINLKIDYENFLPIWNEIFFLSEKNRRVYEIAKGLKKRYALLMLSNVNCLHYRFLRDNFPVFDAFHNVVISCEVGLTKPDPGIYRHALQLAGAQPQEAFYTDDRPELIAAARELGLQAFVFQGVPQLEKDLSNVGISLN